MRPILFSLGRLNFYSYGFFTALGFIIGGIAIDYLAKKKKLITKRQREFFVIDALLFALIVGIIAARLGYIVLYNLIFRLEPFAFDQLIGGGFVFYVGLAASLVALRWWLREEEKPLLAWYDVIIVGVLLGNGLSEVGGYLNDGAVVHIAGSIGNLCLAGLMYALLMTEKKRPGLTFWTGLFSLFLLIFFLGFWRDEKLIWFGLTFGQWASLAGLAGTGTLATRYLKD